MPIIAYAFHAGVLLLCALAAFEDVRTLRIRNVLCLAVALLFIPYALTLPMHDVTMHVFSGLAVFAVALALFFAGLFGGGDAKLVAAVALWMPISETPSFLLVMTITGGFIALAALALRRLNVLPKIESAAPVLYGPPEGWLASLGRGEAVVPYGVAIFIAAAITFF